MATPISIGHRAPRIWSACRGSASRARPNPRSRRSVARYRRSAGRTVSGACEVSVSQAVGCSVPTMTGSRPSRAPSFAARSRTARISWPLTLIGEVGVSQCARQRSACAAASPCQMKLTWPRLTSIGLPWRILARDVVQHAVAHVDRVIQPEQPAGRGEFAREIFEHALAADAGLRIFAGRIGRQALVGALAVDRHERIDAAGRERHDPRMPETPAPPAPGTWAFIAQVSDRSPSAPNLRPAMNTMFLRLRQRLDGGFIEQIAIEGLDAAGLAASLSRWRR